MSWLKEIFLSLFMIFSENEIKKFDFNFTESFSSFETINLIYPELTKETIISRPPNTEIDLLDYKTSIQNFCLSYRTPYAENLGELYFWEGQCDKKIKRNEIIKNIKELKIKYSTSPDKLSLGLQLENGKDHSLEITKIPLAYFKGHLPAISERLGTNSEGRYRDGSFQYCHRVNENCEVIMQNECDRCAYGHYEVVDYSCPGIGGSKICGPSRCGERGEPACVRGINFGVPPLDICSEGSSAGFCQKGLETICDENKILICK